MKYHNKNVLFFIMTTILSVLLFNNNNNSNQYLVVNGKKTSIATKPHILLVVADDFGWGDVSYHRQNGTYDKKVQTPTMDNLVKDGIELNRHYVHMTCTPSRTALQSGRLPVHVLQTLVGPCAVPAAMPRNMTGIASKMKLGGYMTHQVGKWDVGMAYPESTPKGRGYDTSLNYFGHGNWMWSQSEWGGSEDHQMDIPNTTIVDFWDTDKPAKTLNGTGSEEDLFRDRIVNILHDHHNKFQNEKPLFLNYDSKLIHYPLQAPKKYQDKFRFIKDDNRRIYSAMVNYFDDQLKNITETMKELGMWENTLMIFTSDNGAPVKNPLGPCNYTKFTSKLNPENPDIGKGTVCFNGEAGGNNWPLRGGKYSMFEGGTRVNAFISGGYIPKKMIGKKLNGMIHIADWYGTLSSIAGVDPRDTKSEKYGLPKVDSINVWPYLSGSVDTSPRKHYLMTKDAYVSGPWKYILPNTKMIESNWGGEYYPNASTTNDSIDNYSFLCPSTGCLYNVVEDPEEHNEVSSKYPKIVEELKVLLLKEVSTIYNVPHTNDPKCQELAYEKYSGFYGPFREVKKKYTVI